MTGSLQRLAILSRAPILPHDRIVNGLTGLAVPNDGSFALIGNTDGGDVLGGNVRLLHYGSPPCDYPRPNFLRIMLDLAPGLIKLAQFHLRGGEWSQRCIKGDCSRRGRSLIDCDESGRQRFSPSTQAMITLVHPRKTREQMIGLENLLTRHAQGYDEAVKRLAILCCRL